MEDSHGTERDSSSAHTSSHRRQHSSSGLLSKIPFMKSLTDNSAQGLDDDDDDHQEEQATASSGRALAAVSQQLKTRKRRGSLRKAALLGRGAQRDKRETQYMSIDTGHPSSLVVDSSQLATHTAVMDENNALSLEFADSTPRPSLDAATSDTNHAAISTPVANGALTPFDRDPEPSTPYQSTTEEEDTPQIPHDTVPPQAGLLALAGSQSYFVDRATAQIPRSFQQTKSPLSFNALAKTTLPPPDSDWDYSETEWWGWVMLCVTWFVFVIGMGSCLDVWSWAWDVGKTPYAPPELEDDPTLPIVGYYPALIILTGVMAWVWVVIAWVGMKYFRHAKISGD